MPELNGNDVWTYGTRFENDKHVPGTARVKESDNPDFAELELTTPKKKKFRDRVKEYWILDFLPVIIETLIWVVILGRFFGAGSYITFLIPFSYIGVILLVVLAVEINEWVVFGFKKQKSNKVPNKNFLSCL